MSSIFDLFKQIESENQNQTEPNTISYIVAGLGNPGDKYTFTRHNTGFLALDFIAQKLGIRLHKLKFKSLCAEAALNGRRVLFLKPQTFMNLSGEAVRAAADFYKIPPENILVIFDDVNFDVGTLRIRRSGSDGGHNGMKNIIYQMNSNACPRIKIGVGKKPSPNYDLAEFVLGTFSEADRKILFSTFENVYDCVMRIVGGDIDKAMSLYNK